MTQARSLERSARLLFNSYVFIFSFLPITLTGYYLFSGRRYNTASKVWLVSVSFFFYAWWNVVYLPLLAASIAANYFFGKSLSKPEVASPVISRKTLLVMALCFNISLLAFFKYFDFFIANLNHSFNANIALLNIALPLGISFFTITQITYLVDSYEGLVKKVEILDYSLFVTFFPHLLMGPILHHKQMIPQFENHQTHQLNYGNLSRGLILFFIGLLKKVVVADEFAVWANAGFDSMELLNFFDSWATSLSYTFQLYYDFSGYTDMALGVALMFNVTLPINFNSPFKAGNIIEFWQRWHISLTKFITTYIYTPLIKSCRTISLRNVAITTVITMLVAGLWHGSNLRYIVFYLLHAAALVINRYWKAKKYRINSIVAWLLTFSFVNITFTIFRAESLEKALDIIGRMYFIKGVSIPTALYSQLSSLTRYGVEFSELKVLDAKLLLMIGAAFLATLFMGNSNEKAKAFVPNVRDAIIIVFAAVLSVLALNKTSTFLYFNY